MREVKRGHAPYRQPARPGGDPKKRQSQDQFGYGKDSRIEEFNRSREKGKPAHSSQHADGDGYQPGKAQRQAGEKQRVACAREQELSHRLDVGE